MKQLLILTVEDDAPTREVIESTFRDDGHAVRSAASMEECREALKQVRPDIILLDRGLPDGDGLQLCLALRKDCAFRSIPILMLTGKSEVADRVLGLRWGADDYLAKPFEVEELRARVAAIARRVYGAQTSKLASGGITVDLQARTVNQGKREIELTNREFSLLRVFLENPNTVLTRDSLMAAVWKDSAPANAKVVDVTVMSLRRKLSGGEALIVAVRALGYRFAGG